ncbi:hypothetical protein NKDENANG_02370 [Candidatus Entotheonellaceae bacterium PAL068K]
MVIGELAHNPVDQLLQELAVDRPTGFTDARQRRPSPVLQTVLDYSNTALYSTSRRCPTICSNGDQMSPRGRPISS